MERVRIVDVAAAAEVSRATVTNALNGTGRMSAATRQRVRAVAAELGYRVSARMLALGVTRFGDLPWDFLAVPYYDQVVGAALAEAHRHGYSLAVLPAGCRSWDAIGADGVLLLDSPEGDTAAEELRRARVPVTFLGRPADPAAGRPWVDNDHGRSLREVLDHLAGRGGRRIALVAADTADHYTRAGVAAYRSWCRARGLPELLEPYTPGWDAAAFLEDSRPDAVYGLYEPVGHEVLAAAEALGLRVPDDLAVACFSEDPTYAGTPVTTVSHTPGTGGRTAVTTLLGQIEGRRPPSTVVPTRLVVRDAPA